MRPSRQPDEPIIYFNRGISLARLGREEEALSDFNKVLKLDEGNLDALNNKGSILLSLGLYAEALGCFEEILKADRKNVMASYNKACAFARMGEAKKSAAALKRAVQLDRSVLEKAAGDEDFKGVMEHPDFRALFDR